MKFSIALGFLFAGIASSQQLQQVQVKLDSFLRQNQHLKPTAKLMSTKQNGLISTATYQDGPMNLKYQVKTDNNQMKIIGIEQIVNFSNNIQFQPASIREVAKNQNDLKLLSMPLIMPQFTLQPNGQLISRNVFDQVEEEKAEIQNRIEQDREKFLQIMQQKRIELQERLRQNFEKNIKETPLIGAGNHYVNKMTNNQIDHSLIGGDDHDTNWATQIEDGYSIVGGGDHDYAWVNVRIEPTQLLLGADGHDFNPEFIPQGQLVGGKEHDNWIQTAKQSEYPLIDGGDHDNWKIKKERHHKKQNHSKQRRHHSGMAWINRTFSAQEITPYLKEKLPDIIKNAEIVSIQNKGFVWKKGFHLEIQIKEKNGNIEKISVFFKPKKEELLIDKISSVQNTQSENSFPIELSSESKPQKKQIPEENLITIKQDPNPPLRAGEIDPDHTPEIMNLVKQIQFTQNNYINKEIYETAAQVPLLGRQHDMNTKVEIVPLLGGPSDPDHGENLVQKVEEKKDPTFDVTGLRLPGGETDIDHNIGLQQVKTVSKEDARQNIRLELIKKAIEIVKDLGEDDVEDIEEFEDVEDVEKSQAEKKKKKLQHLIK